MYYNEENTGIVNSMRTPWIIWQMTNGNSGCSKGKLKVKFDTTSSIHFFLPQSFYKTVFSCLFLTVHY